MKQHLRKKRDRGEGFHFKIGIYLVLLFLPLHFTHAQQTILSGKVTDAETGEGIPFANLIFLGTNDGTTTDFNGEYRLKSFGPTDSLQVSYLGYQKKIIPVEAGSSQTLNITLTPNAIQLHELVVYSKGNPALELLKKVKANRSLNDKRNLHAYEYERYAKIQISLNNLDSVKGSSRLLKKALSALEPFDSLRSAEGTSLIPHSITETLSKVYYQNNPEIRREDLLKTKMFGVGFDKNSWLSQVMITSLQQYNFYENWVTIMTKNFVSPLADGGKLFYDFYLADSLYIGKDFCYKVECTPKSEQDLAFTGQFWITKEGYALKKIDVTIPETANLNYIETLRIKQELTKTEAGPWLPEQTEIIIDSEEWNNKPGLLITSYLSHKDIVVNNPKPSAFYSSGLTVDEAAYDNTDEYWEKHRHHTLTATDSTTFAAIHALREEPTIKLYSRIIDSFASAYWKFENFELGPYIYSYGRNSIEGHRIRIGIKTSPSFSRRWSLQGYSAYGTEDKNFKYGIDLAFLPDRLPWTELRLHHSSDLSQIGFIQDDEKEIYLFHASAFFGDLSRAYYFKRSAMSIRRQLPYGMMSKISLKNEQARPVFTLHQAGSDTELPLVEEYTTTEAEFSLRFARDENFVQKNNRRVSVGMGKWPVLTTTYTHGVKDLIGGDYNYQKLSAVVDQRVKAGIFGKTIYQLSGSYIFSQLPYPLLNVHLGNNSFFYYRNAFNTMNRYEFISDHFVALRFNHFFEGFILNRVPLIRKLGWRLLASANILYGGTRKENRSYSFDNGVPVQEFGSLREGEPFVEVGYGIENIFKFIRIDAFHRLTYLDKPEVSKFALKIGFQIKF